MFLRHVSLSVVLLFFFVLFYFVDMSTNNIAKLVSSVMQLTNESWLKQDLWASEALIANSDDLSIRKLIGLLRRGGGTGNAHFLFKIHSTVTQFLFDVSDYFFLS